MLAPGAFDVWGVMPDCCATRGRVDNAATAIKIMGALFMFNLREFLAHRRCIPAFRCEDSQHCVAHTLPNPGLAGAYSLEWIDNKDFTSKQMGQIAPHRGGFLCR